MRIIGGTFRSRPIIAPRGLSVRPTSDKARETLFNLLWERVHGAVFLDLFAGTGAVGLEALSRGAERAVFVEKDPRAAAALIRNMATLGVGGRAQLCTVDWLDACRRFAREGSLFDLIFADPPYDQGLSESCLLSPESGAILRSGGLLIIEHRCTETLPDPPAGLVMLKKHPSGEAAFSLYRKEASA